ncbi:beta-ketoacyl-[acyl-carrier-protein] synthase family protein [Paramicrobacterium agarici]|uniref:3-oxoacyl-[acyl-carrier-protein] synthase II n=1 Tax=Paramicrobacterium agarici TaxID=630514 RepID=A0A2A9DXY4_9MICO|nr:beta-ketoacyl-[acyl-carrier-protein] synthase family protein [Microbacterium agarici]PFG30995.1 3-oxoacyl-[acyl-carrier-protein] synthase II [Microbacterium agarici]
MSAGRRAVITAIGAVTPCGLDAESTWDAVVSGRSGIRAFEHVDVSDLAVSVGGEVRNFDPLAFVSRSDAKRLDAHALYAIAAAHEAMSGVEPLNPDRFGVTVATGSGAVSLTQEAVRTLDRSGPRRVPPGVVVYGGPDAAAAYLSQKYDARGASAGLSATCASGTAALGEALRAVRHGYADAILVVGADDCLNRVNLAVNSSLGALAPGYESAPSQASRPFDRARRGFVMSAGAAALLVESDEHARRRGAVALGEIAGYGVSSDAHHPTAPHPHGRGAISAMRGALDDARVTPESVDHVNAHGTGTPLNDAMEAYALQHVFGDALASIPVTSTKSTTGHLLGAAGTLEAALSLLGMRDGAIPPTINLDDPEFPELDVVAHEARSERVSTLVTNSFGFGGHNASLVLRAV